MGKRGHPHSQEDKSSMERRAQKIHHTEGEGSKEHKLRANLLMYAVLIASAWTVLCIILAASGKWRWNEGILFTSHIAILAVFGPLTLYAIWATKKNVVYRRAFWILLIYLIIVTLIILFTL